MLHGYIACCAGKSTNLGVLHRNPLKSTRGNREQWTKEEADQRPLVIPYRDVLSLVKTTVG